MSILITKEDCERGRKVRLRDGSTDQLMRYSDIPGDNFPIQTISGNWYRINGSFEYLGTIDQSDIVGFVAEEIMAREENDLESGLPHA